MLEGANDSSRFEGRPLTRWFEAARSPAGVRPQPKERFRNGLLNALPPETLMRLRPYLERVPLKKRQILHERNLPITHAYFIERGTASLLLRVDGRSGIEVGTLGHSDLAGVPVVLGTARTPQKCVVQVPGEALRIRAEDLQKAMADNPALQRLLFGYVQATFLQSSQLVVCNTRHTVRERLVRWLLVTHDRIHGSEIELTHQSVSRSLGIRRAGVTTAMGRMEEAGLIRRGRGRLVIADREALEREACECYQAIRAEYQRILCHPAPEPSRAPHSIPQRGDSGERGRLTEAPAPHA